MLLGRVAELARIDGLLRDATEGRSAALVVCGEAGIGKSALVDDVAGRAAAATTVLRTRGIEADSTIPYAGLADLLRPVQGLIAALPGPQAAALAGALALGPPTASDRFAVAAATLSLLGVVAEGGALLCVVDDAHWLDPSSAEALVFAARRMRAEGSVIVFTVRDGEPGAARFLVMETLRLAGLDGESGAALVARSVDRALPPQVMRRLLTDTGGNPLALIEAPGRLTEDQLTGRAPIVEPIPVGSLLMEGFLRQVRELPERSREALLVAATSDLEAADLVDRALQETGGSLADLDTAEAAGLVGFGDGRLTFRHPLIRSAVYHAASPAQRRTAHRRLATALDTVAAPQAEQRQAWHLAAATLTSDETVAATLETVGRNAGRTQSHAVAARALERSAGLSPSRADRARRLLAAAAAAVPAGLVQEAIRLLEQAQTWADDPAVAAVAECDRHRLGVWGATAEASRAELFGFAARIADRLPAVATRAYLAASAASLASYDIAAIRMGAERAARLGGSDEQVMLRCDVLAAFAAAQSGDSARAAGLLDAHGAQLAVQDTFDLDQVVTMSGVCYLSIERTGQARPLLARAVDTSRRANAAGLLAVQLPWMAALEWLDGDWTAALALSHEAVLLAPETGWLAQLPNSLSTLARIEAGFGMEQSCREHATRAQVAARSGGQSATAVHALAAMGLLELGLGHADEAADTLRRAADVAGPDAAPLLQLQLLPDLGEAQLRAGLIDDAAATLGRLDELAARTGRHSAAAAAARCHGLLERENFAPWFEEALRRHAGGTPPFDRARTHLAYGERLRRARNRPGARTHLQRALELFDRLGAAPWAARSRAELVSSGGAAVAPGDLIEMTLTPQELQVSLAVRGGLTNAAAASALFLSVKTIEYHLSNIYRKLGVRSRTQLVRALAADRSARAPALVSAAEGS